MVNRCILCKIIPVYAESRQHKNNFTCFPIQSHSNQSLVSCLPTGKLCCTGYGHVLTLYCAALHSAWSAAALWLCRSAQKMIICWSDSKLASNKYGQLLIRHYTGTLNSWWPPWLIKKSIKWSTNGTHVNALPKSAGFITQEVLFLFLDFNTDTHDKKISRCPNDTVPYPDCQCEQAS